ILGKNMSSPDLTEQDILDARREIGMVFQNPDNQIVATVVEEDVAFGPENLGLPSDEIRRRVDEALAMVNMTKYARHAPHKLSGGQKQRIAIAGIIAMRRRCIIFDESTAMLDPVGRKEVMDTIERLNREEGITVLHITHYMTEAVRADRVVVMDKGRIIMDGTPKEVFSQPERLWEVNLDVPQTTELLYRMKQSGLNVRLDIFDPDECADEIAAAIASR
ncbi:MAG: ATP-binding cassette domain-containing protein, partial [Clostridia bacterium]|nr:ATP-binding cassette domain-containing protein [Clostridia bacterium]